MFKSTDLIRTWRAFLSVYNWVLKGCAPMLIILKHLRNSLSLCSHVYIYSCIGIHVVYVYVKKRASSSLLICFTPLNERTHRESWHPVNFKRNVVAKCRKKNCNTSRNQPNSIRTLRPTKYNSAPRAATAQNSTTTTVAMTLSVVDA